MRNLLLVVLFIPLLSFSQMLEPTGRSRTVKESFITIYSPKLYKGYAVQEEYRLQIGATEYRTWRSRRYFRKTLIGKKWYNQKEIYSHDLTHEMYEEIQVIEH